MSKEVVGVEVERRVIVSHCAAQVVDVVACQRTVHVVGGVLRLKVNHLTEICVGVLPLGTRECNHAAHVPGVDVVWRHLQTFVEPFVSGECIGLQKIYLRLQRVGTGIRLPACNDGVEVELRLGVVLVLNTTERTVVPRSLVLRIKIY